MIKPTQEQIQVGLAKLDSLISPELTSQEYLILNYLEDHLETLLDPEVGDAERGHK